MSDNLKLLLCLGSLRYYNKGINCAMKSYKLSELSTSEVESLKTRPRIDFSSIFTTVRVFFLLGFQKKKKKIADLDSFVFCCSVLYNVRSILLLIMFGEEAMLLLKSRCKITNFE